MHCGVLSGACSSSIARSCSTLCDPIYFSTPEFPPLHYLPEFAQTHIHWINNSNQPFYPCCPLLLPLIVLSIRVFPNESAVDIRWPKYWSLGFSISDSNEYSELIFFRIAWGWPHWGYLIYILYLYLKALFLAFIFKKIL